MLLATVLLVMLSTAGAFAQAQTRWYFPEGATGPAFEEFILLANPTSTPANVRLTFLKGDGSPQAVDTIVEPTSRRTICVNQLPGLELNGEVSVIVDSLNGVPVVAERTMYWLGADRRGGHNATGMAAPATTWYLAEGATGFFETYVLLSNPGGSSVTAVLSFQREDGLNVGHVQVVPANSRRTVAVSSVPGMGPNLAFATQITSTGPILVERAMYWLGFAGGHAASAIATPSTTWHFAEGFTAGDYQTFVLLGNPNNATAAVTARFMRDDGVVVARNYSIPARSRLTIHANSVPELLSAAFATSVQSTLPIVAERATYWGGFQEGNVVAGEPALQPRWGFAEGMAGTVDGLPYETFFLFSNPSTSPITVTGTFYREDGTGMVLPITVGAQSRATLFGATVPGMFDQRFAAFFESSTPFLVERAVYWGANRFGGHGSAGVPWTGTIQAPPGLAGPTITPAGGTFSAEPGVQLTSAVPGTIRYTLDGSDPTSGSAAYGGPLTITHTATLRARTFFANGASSQVSSATFNLQVDAPAISPPSGTYTGGQPVTIHVPPNATVRYTTNGATPTETSPLYAGPLAYSGQQIQLRARALRTGWTPSLVAAADFTFTHGTVAMPVPTPGAGLYAPGQNVNLSIPPGSLVHYTLDGSEPTEASPTYHGLPITLQEPATLRARAFAQSFTPSAILTAAYQMRVAAPTMTPNGGSFTSSTLVQFNTATATAVMRYTLDGEDPTASSPQATSLVVPPDSTVKVQAFRPGWEPSTLAAATFVHPSPQIASPAIVQLTGGIGPTSLQQAGGAVQFSIGNGGIDPSTVQIDVNGVTRPTGSVSASAGLVTANAALVDGRNDVILVGLDFNGLLIYQGSTLWAGNRSLQVQVRTPSGTAIGGAVISAELVAEPSVIMTAVTNASGIATLPRLPAAQAVRLTIQSTSYFDKTTVVPAGVASAIVALDIDNNNFETITTNGWIVQSTLPALQPHMEARRPWVDCGSCIPRGAVQAAQLAEPSPANALAGPDWDLMVQTYNTLVPQTITRSFAAHAGTRAVTVRYRFASFEVFYSNPVADAFQVRLRSSSGQTLTDTQTVFSLLPFFTNGVTAWRTLTIPVSSDGETITLEASVTNNVDAALVSYVEVDKLEESRYSASARLVEYRDQPPLNTTTNEPLDYLSVSPHTYWNSMTRVRGTLTLTGPESDSVSDVELRIYEAEDLEHRATGRLPLGLRPSVLRSFGTTGQNAVSTAQLLFEIPGTELADFGQTTDGELLLRLRVSYASGRPPLETTIRYAQKLVRYTGANRYGERDADPCIIPPPNAWIPYPCGGDDWARPSTSATLALPALSGFNFGDFSNMNGGKFPIHTSLEHQQGRGVDAQFTDAALTRRDRNTADALITLLNSSVGPRVVRIGVTFTAAMRQHLEQAPNLVNGRRPLDYIMNWPGHADHIHIGINGNVPLRP
ncbi:MAG: chitobiase/beta-hexosaminidase C-terminal domain-containing protein [Vicinamibacteraceae bacterium]